VFAYGEGGGGGINGLIPCERVIGYGFRGDTRPPGEVKGAGGFLPNYTRPAHIKQHAEKVLAALKEAKNPGQQGPPVLTDAGKQKLEQLRKESEGGALNLTDFITNQEFKGFISTSKSIKVAQAFATSGPIFGGKYAPYRVPGWVYACFVEGAFHIPRQFDTPLGLIDEQELTMPGLVEWQDVVACREVSKPGTECRFTGPVYMKPSLLEKDWDAAIAIWCLLSGKSQG
jgi:hypothetical protein